MLTPRSEVKPETYIPSARQSAPAARQHRPTRDRTSQRERPYQRWTTDHGPGTTNCGLL